MTDSFEAHTDQDATRQPPPPVSLMTAFLYWLKLGFISFGGPAGQISMMHTELVERRRWISEHRFLHALNYTMVLPGPEAQQLATYIGWLMHGTLGGIMAGTLFVLPSLAILMGLTWVYLVYGDTALVAGILYGIKPAVTAIVVFAAYRIGSRALRNGTLWALAEGALYLIYGWQGPLTQMGWFITKAALVTFGGAYAVLPYVYQGGVEHYQWLTGTQMIDGLALGETTPGPLIMIVAFVGFVGGWTREIFVPDSLALAGAAGASVATLFTFLPSFLFILIGAPAVEASRHDLKFTAPLTGITAAVVGVIINLAVFFAWHVLWPDGTDAAPFSGRFEWFSLLITIGAFLALWRYKVGIIPVLGACSAVGLVYSLLA